MIIRVSFLSSTAYISSLAKLFFVFLYMHWVAWSVATSPKSLLWRCTRWEGSWSILWGQQQQCERADGWSSGPWLTIQTASRPDLLLQREPISGDRPWHHAPLQDKVRHCYWRWHDTTVSFLTDFRTLHPVFVYKKKQCALKISCNF